MSRKIIIPKGLVEDPNQSSVIEVSPRLNQTTGNLIARRQGGRLVAQQLPDWQDSYSSHRGLENTFVATPLGCRPDQTQSVVNPNVTFDVMGNDSGNTTDNFYADSSDPSIQHSLACYSTPLSETPSRAEFTVTSDELNLSSFSESNIEMSDVMMASILNKIRGNLYEPKGNLDDVRKRLFTDSDQKQCSCSQDDSMYGGFQPLASSSGIDLTQTIAPPRSTNQTRTVQPRANQSYRTPQSPSNETYTAQAPRNVTRTMQPGSMSATLPTNQTYTCPGNRTRIEPGKNKTFTAQRGNIPAADQTYEIPQVGNTTFRRNQSAGTSQLGKNQTYIKQGDTFSANQTYSCPSNRTRIESGGGKNLTYTRQQLPGNITKTIQPGRNQTYTAQGNSSRSATFSSNQIGTNQTFNVSSKKPYQLPRCARSGFEPDASIQDNSNNITDFPTDESYGAYFQPEFTSTQRDYSTLYDSSEVSYDVFDGVFSQQYASPCPCGSGEQEAPSRQDQSYTGHPNTSGRSRRSLPRSDGSSRSTNQTRRYDQSFDTTFNPPLSSTPRSSKQTGGRPQNRRQDTYSIPSSMEKSSSRVDECGCSPPGADSIVSYSSHVVEDEHEED